jgi:hypothetical protein
MRQLAPADARSAAVTDSHVPVALHDPLFDPVAAGAYLGGTKPIARQTLAKWRCTGLNGPAWVRLGSVAIRYRQSDLDAWLAKQGRFASTSDRATSL